MTGKHYSEAEETFLRSKISTMLQYGYGVDKITEALKIPRATVADRIKKLRMEAMSRSEDYYQSLPLELEHALGNLGTVWMMALTLYRDPQARMSYASRVNLLSTLKTIVESRVDILSNVSIIKDIATYTEQQRVRIEKLQKQSIITADQDSKTIDEMMAQDHISIKDLAMAASKQRKQQNQSNNTNTNTNDNTNDDNDNIDESTLTTITTEGQKTVIINNNNELESEEDKEPNDDEPTD